MRRPPVRALFRVAAGPRLGFGHLVRARTLSKTLGIERPLVSLRGGPAARRTALSLGMRPVDGTAAALLEARRPEVLIIDDPSSAAASPWCSASRRAGIPVASLHDLGTAFCGADLSIDGSITTLPGAATSGAWLRGVRYAVLDETLKSAERRGGAGSPVLIALGGGPRRSVARRIAGALREARPSIRVRVAGGFADRGATKTDGVTWLGPQPGLARELATCAVAITGGGVSLYEAVTIGTPVVAWPVVEAQRPTVEAFASRGLGRAVGPGRDRVSRAVAAVLEIIDSGCASMGSARKQGFDGRGARRVAAAVERLARARGRAA